MTGERACRINFSHVLHERSTCTTVQDAVRNAARFASKRERFTAKFRRYTDIEFERRLTVAPRLQDMAPPSLVLSPAVGLPEMLPRALPMIASAKGFSLIDPFKEPVEETDGVYVQFFGSLARVNHPAALPDASPCLVAACVLRPDGDSLLITGELVQNPLRGSKDKAIWNPDVFRALENVIREHSDQWTPNRQLWDRPVEDALPEFTTQTLNR